MCDDVDRFIATRASDKFDFNNFMDRLSEIIKQLEGWQIKLLSFQSAIIIIIIIGFVDKNASSMSFFGISIPYSREILVILSFTIGILMGPITAAKELRIMIVQRIIEVRYEGGDELLMKLAHASSFNFQIYVARNFDKWIFSRPLKKLLIFLTFVTGIFAVLTLFVITTIILLLVVIDIWNNPKIDQPLLSVFFAYCILALLFSIMTTIIYWVPLPHRDQSVLQRLEELQSADPIAYRALLEEVFGNDRQPNGEG